MAKKKAVKKTAIKKGSAAAKAKMAKVRKAKKNYILVEADRQTKVKTTNSGGYLYPYNVAKDKLKKAMPPGKRISKKTGNPYWEYRVNRSDKKGSLTGFTISGIKSDVLNKLADFNKKIDKYTEMNNVYSAMAKNKGLSIIDKKHYRYMANTARKHLNSFKRQVNALKKLI